VYEGKTDDSILFVGVPDCTACKDIDTDGRGDRSILLVGVCEGNAWKNVDRVGERDGSIFFVDVWDGAARKKVEDGAHVHRHEGTRDGSAPLFDGVWEGVTRGAPLDDGERTVFWICNVGDRLGPVCENRGVTERVGTNWEKREVGERVRLDCEPRGDGERVGVTRMELEGVVWAGQVYTNTTVGFGHEGAAFRDGEGCAIDCTTTRRKIATDTIFAILCQEVHDAA